MKKDLTKFVGKKGSILTRGDGGMRINVKVLDCERQYGKIRWLVTPVSGMGQVWTEQEPIIETK